MYKNYKMLLKYCLFFLVFFHLSMATSPLNGDSLTDPPLETDLTSLDSFISGNPSKHMSKFREKISNPDKRKNNGRENMRMRTRSRRKNFYSVSSNDLNDGEHEVRINYSRVSAKQTSVGPSEGSPG